MKCVVNDDGSSVCKQCKTTSTDGSQVYALVDGACEGGSLGHGVMGSNPGNYQKTGSGFLWIHYIRNGSECRNFDGLWNG